MSRSFENSYPIPPISPLSLSICLLLFLWSCDSELIDTTLNSDELKPFVIEFIDEGQKRGFTFDQNLIDFDIQFGNLPEGKAGSCRKVQQLITIDPNLWRAMDPIQRKALVFHELAHCILDRDHKNSTLPRGECASLMVKSVSDSTCFYDFYSGHWQEYYLDELFNVADEIPQWYYSDPILSNSNLVNLVLDTTVSNHYSPRLPTDLLYKDYQITINSFHNEHIIINASIRWEYLTSDLHFDEGTMQIESLFESQAKLFSSHVVPRVYHTDQIPQLVDEIILRKQNGFYDIFINAQHIYRSSTDLPTASKRDRFSFSFYAQRAVRIDWSLQLHSFSLE